jgi:glycosyltransferase involved in cell wall biosynthesis
MKIAFLIPSLENKGPSVFTKYLVNGIVEHVDSVVVYYFSDKVSSLGVLDFGVETRKISFFKKEDFSEFDIVHSTMLKPDLYCFYHDIYSTNNVVNSMHNYFVKDLSYLYGFFKSKLLILLWLLALTKTRCLVVSSEDMKRYYSRVLARIFFTKKKFDVIPYGISVTDFSEITCHSIVELKLKYLKDNYTVLGSCGLLIKRKGFYQLLHIAVHNPDVAIVIIGDGPERASLELFIKNNNLEDRVCITGLLQHSINYYQFFDVFVMASFSEGFGLAMLEALSHKLPLVCSNLPVYENYFSKNEVCLFEPGNISSLQNAVDNVIRNYDRFSNNSFILYNKHFSLKVMASRHISLYASLINKVY